MTQSESISKLTIIDEDGEHVVEGEVIKAVRERQKLDFEVNVPADRRPDFDEQGCAIVGTDYNGDVVINTTIDTVERRGVANTEVELMAYLCFEDCHYSDVDMKRTGVV